MRGLALLLLVGTLAGSGCGTAGYYRYTRVDARPAAARAAIRDTALAHDLTPIERPLVPDADFYRAYVDPNEADAETDGIGLMTHEEAPPASTPSASPAPKRRVVGMRVRAFPEGAGSLVEVAAPLERLIDAVMPDGRTYRAVDGFVWSDRVPWELAVEPGLVVRGDPHALADAIRRDPSAPAATWRVDTMVRVGGRVLTRGGGRWDAAPRFGLSVLGGVGLAVAEIDPAARWEVTLSADLQSTVRPIDVVIPRGRRYAVDLSVAALTGLADEHVGVEASLALHVSPWGGVFARAGYQNGERQGTTWMAGVKLDTVPTLYVVGAALVGALIVGLANADYSTCGGVHSPCAE